MANASIVIQLLPAVAMIVLAVFMLFKQPRGTKSQSFGVLMFLLAGRIVFHKLQPAFPDHAAVFESVANAYLVALPASILAFVLACTVRHPAWVIVPPLALAGFLATFQMLNPCMFVCTTGAYQTGPLAFLIIAWPIWPALAGLWLAIEARRKPDDPCSSAGQLVSGAFILTSLAFGLLLTLTPFVEGWGNYRDILDGSVSSVVVGQLILPVAIAAMVVLLASLPANLRLPRLKVFAGLGLIIAANVAWTLNIPWGEYRVGNLLVWAGIHSLIPAMMAFALLRHRLFDIDVTMRITISRTTFGAMFVAVFFIVSEIASEYFGHLVGNQYYGIIAAALLVFAWVPLQNMAEKFAQSLLPADDADGTGNEAMYLRQAKLVWADGTMGRKERMILDQLQKDLDIHPSKAAELEHKAFLSHGDNRKNLSVSVS